MRTEPLERLGSSARRESPVRRILAFSTAVIAAVLVTPTELEAARTCTITVTAVAFGNYPPTTTTPVDSTGLIQVACVGTPDTGQPDFYTIRISGGTSGNPADRQMRSGVNPLSYNLFQDATLTTVWGDGTGGTTPLVQSVSGMGMGMAIGFGMGMGMASDFTVDHPVYGRSFAGQDPAPGSYADTPIVTIDF